MSDVSRVVPWAEQGCGVCRSKWGGVDLGEPCRLGDSDPPGATIWRCRWYGAYWSEGWSNPHQVTRAEALRELPDLAERERLRGSPGREQEENGRATRPQGGS